MGARVKRPGAAMVSMPVELSVVEHPQGDELDAYERLLGDAMRGDTLLFVRQDAVEAAWTIVEPILGNVTPVYEYAPHRWGPAEADRLASDIGGWHNPEAS
jgi:glucose-6-phosphate 1-dehydrogenase